MYCYLSLVVRCPLAKSKLTSRNLVEGFCMQPLLHKSAPVLGSNFGPSSFQLVLIYLLPSSQVSGDGATQRRALSNSRCSQIRPKRAASVVTSCFQERAHRLRIHVLHHHGSTQVEVQVVQRLAAWNFSLFIQMSCSCYYGAQVVSPGVLEVQ